MPGWIVLLPPLFVLLTVIITKRIHASLILGICVAAFIASNQSFYNAIKIIFNHTRTFVQDIDNVYLFGFLIIIGILVILIDRTGGARAFAHMLTRHIKSAQGAESASVLLSFALFVDDYLSNLTVGYVMQKVTKQYRIPCAKLAYLVHSISIPLVIITPLSSWMAMITDQLYQSGISPEFSATTKIIADPFFTYLYSIPYIFYSFFMLTSLLFIIRKKVSYGPMRKEEQDFEHSCTANTSDHQLNRSSQDNQSNDSIVDLILPICTLIVMFVAGILYTGEHVIFGGSHSLIEAFKHNDQTFIALFTASATALSVGLIAALIRKKIMLRNIPNIIFEGSMLMIPAIMMLVLSSILGRIIRLDLKTGTYLADLVSGILSPVFLPFIFFIISTAASTLMGSSWATIALFLPIAVPMIITVAGVNPPAFASQIALLYPMLGAIFSGAVCGDNLSPISQTTMMASTSSGCNPITHVNTQFPYALPAVISTAIAYLIIGFLINYPEIRLLSSFFIGLALTISLVVYFNRKK